MKITPFKKFLNENNKENIAIIGHMGSGKSIIGKILAKQFNSKHIDSDEVISKYLNKSIYKIFEEKGEKYFRSIEKKMILDLIEKKNTILSLGGGSVLDKTIRKKLKMKSITLFLNVNLSELEKRLKN